MYGVYVVGIVGEKMLVCMYNWGSIHEGGGESTFGRNSEACIAAARL